MTGYGRGEAADATHTLSLEISGVNRKQLEVVCSLPREWQSLERRIVEAVRARVSRGRVSLNAQLRASENAELQWDKAAVATRLNELKTLCEANAVPFEPTPALVLKIATTSASAQQTPQDDALWAFLQPALESALAAFTAMRKTEGDALKADIAARAQALESLLAQIKQHAPQVVTRYREQLFTRLKTGGLELDLNDERVLKEISLFADRCDIAEETTRLESHFTQLRACLSATEPVGRKLDFLCQEINREFNTIGSKASFLEITKAVLEAKNELERLREQVQNVE